MSVKNDPSARHPDKKNGMQRRLNLTQRRKEAKAQRWKERAINCARAGQDASPTGYGFILETCLNHSTRF